MEPFLILLWGGVMLAAAVPSPRTVTLNWLRLAGIIALSCAGVGLFVMGREIPSVSMTAWVLCGGAAAAVMLELAASQTGKLAATRVCAVAGGLLSIGAAYALVRPASLAAMADARVNPIGPEWLWLAVSLVGVAAMSGLVLMTMLIGHAYLTESNLTMAPFRRLNGTLAACMIVRAVVAVGATMLMVELRPIEGFWLRWGFNIFVRWFVGLLVPGVFVYMAHDCIKRRSNQSATGILYVASVLIFIGEICALSLVTATGLPF